MGMCEGWLVFVLGFSWVKIVVIALKDVSLQVETSGTIKTIQNIEHEKTFCTVVCLCRHDHAGGCAC
jgi:hypothetical protein